MSSSFWALNLKGIDGLFSGVSRCCSVWLVACEHVAARRMITYHLKGCAPRGAGDLKGPLLLLERGAKRSCAASKRPRRNLGGHCDVKL